MTYSISIFQVIEFELVNWGYLRWLGRMVTMFPTQVQFSKSHDNEKYYHNGFVLMNIVVLTFNLTFKLRKMIISLKK